jgi:hypothetical protein
MQLLKNVIYHWEDVVSKEIQEYILNQHLGPIKYEFAATRKPQANFIKNPIDIDSIKIQEDYKKIKLRPGIFQSVFVEDGDWEQKKEVYSKSILPPLDAIAKLMGFDYNLMKLKSNFNYNDSKSKDTCFIPHCDFEGVGGWTLLYYINDADGETIIFDHKGMNYLTLGKELQIKRTISPKQGSVVMFNQDYLHAGCPPTESDYRLIINYNITIKNKMPEIKNEESCCKSENL